MKWTGYDWMIIQATQGFKDDDATIHSHPCLSLLRSFTTMPLDAHKNQHGCACKPGFQGLIINNFPMNLPCWGVFGIPYLQRPFTFRGKVPIHSIDVTHSKSHLQCSHFIPNDRQWPSLCRVTTLSRSSCGQNAKVGCARCLKQEQIVSCRLMLLSNVD